VILDTSKHIQGNLLPSFKYQNPKEDLSEFANQEDLSALLEHNALTIANNIEVSRFLGLALSYQNIYAPNPSYPSANYFKNWIRLQHIFLKTLFPRLMFFLVNGRMPAPN